MSFLPLNIDLKSLEEEKVILSKNNIPKWLRRGGQYKVIKEFYNIEENVENEENVDQDQIFSEAEDIDTFEVPKIFVKPNKRVYSLNDWIWLFKSADYWDVVVPETDFFNNRKNKSDILDYLLSLEDAPRIKNLIKKLSLYVDVSENEANFLLTVSNSLPLNKKLDNSSFLTSYSLEEMNQIMSGDFSLIRNHINDNSNNDQYLFNQKINLYLQTELVLNQSITDFYIQQNIYLSELYNLDDGDLRKILPLFIFNQQKYYINRFADFNKILPYIIQFRNYRNNPTDLTHLGYEYYSNSNDIYIFSVFLNLSYCENIYKKIFNLTNIRTYIDPFTNTETIQNFNPNLKNKLEYITKFIIANTGSPFTVVRTINEKWY